ncbi:VOC family protein [Streptomyces sp. NPDC058286]|uniref:VOC family protein n=1 Tax=unclassified Streptomyces TaxID=2593676 RepID=UPI0036E55682
MVAVLGGDIADFRGDGSWVDLRPPAGQRMSFQLSPGLKPSDWPAVDHDSQQLLLDLAVEDIDAAQQTVIALGARPLDLEDLPYPLPFAAHSIHRSVPEPLGTAAKAKLCWTRGPCKSLDRNRSYDGCVRSNRLVKTLLKPEG